MFDKYRIIVILTAYKRDYFREQITALLNQTIKPCKIILLNNGTLNVDSLRHEFGISLINSDLNTKFWGRFCIAKLFNTEYVLMVDDDTIPGKMWIENCLKLCESKNSIITGNGRTLTNAFVSSDDDIQVAFGGHSWFYKKEWLKYFLIEDPINYDTGEDIMFSALCKIHGNIETWMPKQNGETSSEQISYSNDEHASFRRHSDWDSIRQDICNHYINRGWKL